jgi:hypothetical protein
LSRNARASATVGAAIDDDRFRVMRIDDHPTACAAMPRAFLTAAANGTW